MLSLVAHYKNKFPGGQVYSREDSLDVYDASGAHVVALRKTGAGQWSDESVRLGCAGAAIVKCDKHPSGEKQVGGHDLSPIPKDARVWKHYSKKGERECIAPSEEAQDRAVASKELAKAGKILSIEEYKAEGWQFEPDGAVKAKPKQA